MPTITGVRCRPFPHPLKQQLLVDVETDDGLIGTGEAWWGIASGPNGDPSAPFAPMVAAIDSLLAPRVVGRDATAIERTWQDLADWAYRYGDGGIITSALAGIDIALWDLAGKRLGVPVAELATIPSPRTPACPRCATLTCSLALAKRAVRTASAPSSSTKSTSSWSDMPAAVSVPTPP